MGPESATSEASRTGEREMSFVHERSAGVIPFRRGPGRIVSYLIIHSARIRNPRARWEFPKGGIEPGESPEQAAARELREETGITSWAFCDGYSRDTSYVYIRCGRRRLKTVTYFVGEVFDQSCLGPSIEHTGDASGVWYRWGSYDEISRLLCHAKIRRLFAEADAWLRGRHDASRQEQEIRHAP